MKGLTWLMTAVFFTASFDTIFTINLGGNLRLAQLLMIFVILAAIGKMIQARRVLWPRGETALAIWCALQFVFIGNSEVVLLSVQLYVLLMLAVLGNLAILQLYGRSEWFPLLFKRYLQSYVFVGAFGLIQFISPALHLGAPLVRQWIVHGLIPRICGFNFEPSYFSTYLILGAAMLVDLRINKAQITSGRRWYWITLMVASVLFLSTSKTAWLAMLLEATLRVFPSVRRYITGQVIKLRQGKVTTPLPRLRALLLIGVMLVFALAGVAALSRVVNPLVFLEGSGIGGTSSQSYSDRAERGKRTLEIAEEHPWIGLSLGGVAPQVAIKAGGRVVRLLDAQGNWGFPVIIDTLAASGFPGFLPFLWYFGIMMLGESKLVRSRWDDERAKWLHAMIRALALEWFVLLSDQFLLRVYFWLHVGMLMVVAYNLRYVPAKALEPEMEERLVAA